MGNFVKNLEIRREASGNFWGIFLENLAQFFIIIQDKLQEYFDESLRIFTENPRKFQKKFNKF